MSLLENNSAWFLKFAQRGSVEILCKLPEVSRSTEKIIIYSIGSCIRKINVSAFNISTMNLSRLMHLVIIQNILLLL